MMLEAARWRSDADIYRTLESNFDELAASYDEDIGANLVGLEMREEFRRSLRTAFPLPSRLFEIGCGTGTDALWLARAGHEVVATDISEQMLARLAVRAKAEGLDDRVRCRKLAARDIATMEQEFGAGSFDGGYSHAGALNMEPELNQVPDGLHRLIKPEGAFVCTLINKTSLFEILFYPLILRPRKAFRRMGNRVPLPISRKPPLNARVVPARFYSPEDARRMFQPAFRLEDVRGVRIVLPPANLTDEYARFRAAFLALERIEARISRAPLLRSAGHHSILTFRRN